MIKTSIDELSGKSQFSYREVRNMFSQLTVTCLKSIIETLEKGVKYVQS